MTDCTNSAGLIDRDNNNYEVLSHEGFDLTDVSTRFLTGEYEVSLRPHCSNYVRNEDWTYSKYDDGLSITTTSARVYTLALNTCSYTQAITSTEIDRIINYGCEYGTSWRTVGYVRKAPGERMREILRLRSAPAILRRRQSLVTATDMREIRARSTLRNMLGDKFFRKFLRDGFITVVSKSGLTYRVYPGQGMTEVYDRGIMVERLCVILKGNFPPTDELIMRYLLILNDEGEFSKFAIHSRGIQRSVKLVPQIKRLPELFAELKEVA